MTIESIRIQNFQAHSDLLVELDPRVTSIIGPSDVGKSSVIRALRWAALNVPVSSLIRNGTKQATVELVVDGRTITRSRGAENVYKLDGQEYKAFRTDVPTDIASLLKLGDANFQGQHDPIYWFSSTAGDVSRQLNAVVDLGIIDSTLAETVRFVNKAKTVMQIAEETLSRSVAERDGLAWVGDADDDLKRVEQKADKQDKLKDRRLSLNVIVHAASIAQVDAWEAADEAIDSEKLLAAMGAAGKAQKRVASLDVLIRDASKSEAEKSVEIPCLAVLSAAAETVAEVRKQKKSEHLGRLIRNARMVEAAKDEELPDIANLQLLAELLETRASRRKELSSLLNEVHDKNDTVWQARNMSRKAAHELDTKTEGRCPLCGKEMSE